MGAYGVAGSSGRGQEDGRRAGGMKRTMLMLAGIMLIGGSVGLYRMGGFGTDPFSCMNLGISSFLGLSFGNWQLIANAALLAAVWMTVRECIGLGTVINMVLVGYLADFVCWLFQEQLCVTMGLPLRIVFLLAGMVLITFGCACYMAAGLGIAPYDSIAFIITKYTHTSFRLARAACDAAAVLAGIAFCTAAGESVWQAAGIGTALGVCCNGPLIQFFREKIEVFLR